MARFPSIDDLRVLLHLWKATHDEKAGTMLKAYKLAQSKLGMKPDIHYHTRYKRVVKYYGREFFTEPWGINPQCSELVGCIQAAVSGLDQIRVTSPDGMRLRLGVGHSVSMSLAPPIVARFRQQCPEVDVEIVVDTSVPLVRRFQCFELDVLLTCLPHNVDTIRNPVEAKPLSPALIARRMHPLAEKFRDAGTPFLDARHLQPADSTAIHIFEGGQPAIRAPRGLLEEWQDVRYVRQSSYALVNAVVAEAADDEGGDLGITIPQLLTSDQARKVQVIPLSVTEDKWARLLMATISQEKPGHVCVKDALSNQQYKKALNQFEAIAREAIKNVPSTYVGVVPAHQYRAYLEMPLPGGGSGRTWYRGSFTRHTLDSSSFVGDFKIKEIWTGQDWDEVPLHRFTVEGFVLSPSESGAARFAQVVATGIRSPSDEGFCVNLVGEKVGDEMKSPLVGFWQGQEQADSPSIRPSAGFIVLQRQADDELDYQRLLALVGSWLPTALLPAWASR